ncbi:MAG: TIR domain-containing protein [Hominisplanchenecus sp.]
MDLNTMKSYLEGVYKIREQKETGNAEQLKLENGAVINIFRNGNYNVQGKNNVEVKEYIEMCVCSGERMDRNKKVFIVYGHDEKIRTELENILRRWGLEPVILDKMDSGGKTIIEKLESQMPEIGYGIVLATADDEGYRKNAPNEKMYRCRQNVVLELGMLLAKLGRDRIAILLQHPKETERPSDIQGLLYIPFEDRLEPEASKLLAREVEEKLKITIPASKL